VEDGPFTAEGAADSALGRLPRFVTSVDPRVVSVDAGVTSVDPRGNWGQVVV
jgi:hypothetical protein